MKKIVIFGAGGFAREVHQIIDDINAVEPAFEFLGFLDGNPALHGSALHGATVLGGIDWLRQVEAAGVAVVVAIGNTASKRKIVSEIERQAASQFVALVHPRAWVGARVAIGAGAIICAGALITTDITIGRHVIINIGATVGHDVSIEDYATVAPAANVSGSVRVGEGCDLGTGCAIIQGKDVGNWSVVGAGAVVVKHVAADVTVVGAPAQVIKTRHSGWHLD